MEVTYNIRGFRIQVHELLRDMMEMTLAKGPPEHSQTSPLVLAKRPEFNTAKMHMWHLIDTVSAW